MFEKNNIAFTKMAGTGNDFIVFDNRSKIFKGNEKSFFQKICRRRVSIGADGVLLLETGTRAPIRMRYYNSDGIEAPMCGNGARCIGFYAKEKKIVGEDRFDLEVSDSVHRLQVNGNMVTLSMAEPKDFRSGLNILKETGLQDGGYIDTGVPHFVIFTDRVIKIDVEKVAPFYRNHKVFAHGANIDFVEIKGRDHIHVRTYERGVEKETLSCGTGCVASALIASHKFKLNSPVNVSTSGGELLVYFDEKWKKIFLKAQVEIIYEGVLVS